jgi:hypothetical protein
VGPFEAAKKRFFKGTVIPICAGWFGEVNKDYGTLIATLAREAAAGDNVMQISPLVNSDRKGGAYQIMLQQFRRAIRVSIIQGNANHKLGRLHYVRESMEEAANASTAHHSAKNGTQATTHMLVGIMPIHQMDTKHTCSLGVDSSAGYFKEG